MSQGGSTQGEENRGRAELAAGGTPRRTRSRVLIVDDLASMRRYLRAVLAIAGVYEVAGEAADCAAAVEMAGLLKPDIVLLDISLPDGDGCSCLGPILRIAPGARVVIASAMDPAFVSGLLEAGAAGFIPKDLEPLGLLDALDSILAAGAPHSEVGCG